MKDKNGYNLTDGTPVRLAQTSSDYEIPSRIYHIKEIDGERVLVLPLSELRNADSNFYAVESVR